MCVGVCARARARVWVCVWVWVLLGEKNSLDIHLWMEVMMKNYFE